MTEIQQNRWDQLVRRSANVVGGGSQVNDTLNELFPIIDVEHLPAELARLSGINLAMCSSLLAASALDINKHMLFNPAASGSLLVVERVIMSSTSSTPHRLAIQAQALTGAAGNEARRDTREGIPAQVLGQNLTQQSAAGITPDTQWHMEADVPFTIEDQNGLFVLFPGSGLVFAPTVVNLQTICAFYWRERVFEPAEINF